MSHALDAAALDQLFRTARTQNAFLDKPVPESLLKELYDLVKWGPTAANTTPARFVFVTSKEAKDKLAPALSEGNLAKTMAAPVTVIIGFDTDFHEKLPYLFPHTDAKAWFDGPQEGRHEAAIRNGSLQGAYLIPAARALGWMPARCPASTRPRSTKPSSPAPPSSRISWSTWVTVIRRACSRACRACRSTKRRASRKSLYRFRARCSAAGHCCTVYPPYDPESSSDERHP